MVAEVLCFAGSIPVHKVLIVIIRACRPRSALASPTLFCRSSAAGFAALLAHHLTMDIHHNQQQNQEYKQDYFLFHGEVSSLFMSNPYYYT